MLKYFTKAWWNYPRPEYITIDKGHVKVDSTKWFASEEFKKAHQEYLDSDFYKFHFGNKGK